MNSETPTVITADKIKIIGPKVDGSFNLTFEVGQYEQGKIARLLLIPQQTIIKLTISQEEDDSGYKEEA